MADFNRLRLMPQHLLSWRGAGFLIGNLEGLVGGGSEGFYHRQTRFLSRFVFDIDGKAPRSVSANPVAANAMIAYYLAVSPAGAKGGPEPQSGGDGGEIVRRGIEVQINRVLAGGLRHEIWITNHAFAAVDIVLRWELEADFADLSEAMDGRRQQEAPVERVWRARKDGGELCLRYRHKELNHATTIRLSGPGKLSDGGSDLRWLLHLEPQRPAALSIDVLAVFRGEAVALGDPDGAPIPPPPLRLEAANPMVQTAWDRAVADLESLALLDGKGVEQRTPAAGIPRYSALFGRDVLVAGFQGSLLDPAMLRGSLQLVAEWNATEYDDAYDAQPGRVIHQRQLSPLALLRKNPFLHYYGDYSAPGWFLIDAAWSFALTGDRELYLSLRDKVLATLEWMERDGDADKDGFYEYETMAGDLGEKNQGWKDSHQAILYPDGRLVRNPLALVEIQGCYYAAKQLTALAFAALGEPDRAAGLLRQAAALKRRFTEAFWLDDLGFYALALDSAKKPVATVAGDPGQCLAYGIVAEAHAAAVADRLMQPDLFTGWGLRTLSSQHPAFNPFAYHLGSVWPVSTATIGFGLKRYGFNAHLHRVAKAMFEASRLFELHRLPETFGGHQRDAQHPHPGIYPEANAPQAWSATAIVLLVHAMLGVIPLAPIGKLIVDPDLPEWLPQLTLSNLTIGAARVSLRFRRDPGGETHHEVLACDGELEVCRAAETASGVDRFERIVRAAAARR